MRITIAVVVLLLGFGRGVGVASEVQHSARPWLGIAMTVRMSPKGSRFLYVGQIGPRTPAESADIRGGDVITHFDGKTVEFRNDLDVIEAVSRLQIGQKIDVTIMRAGARLKRTIIVGAMPPDYEAAWKETHDQAVRRRTAKQ